MELSGLVIKEIAESIDMGSTCYVNPETGEMEEFLERRKY